MLSIDRDLGRFRDIVKGRVRKDLRRYMSSGELVGRKGKEMVSIPLPQIGIPRLRYGDNKQGVGQGEGDQGDGSGQGPRARRCARRPHARGRDQRRRARRDSGRGARAAPNRAQRLPRGGRRQGQVHGHLQHRSRVAPPQQAHLQGKPLKRTIASGTYDPRRPIVVPIKEDKRYRTFEYETQPRSAAVVVYMMDVSGSMGREQKEIVRSEAFWIDTWLRHNYDDVETRFIIHDATAREVDRDTFFRTRESGGTLISSAYKLCLEILEREYPPSEWNIYPFHFSDGDNWSQSDTRTCIEMLRDRLIPIANQFSYAQGRQPVRFRPGSSRTSPRPSTTKEAVCLSRIPGRDAIMDSIKELLGRGR